MAVLIRDADTPGAASAAGLARIVASPWFLAVVLLAAFAAYAPTLDDWFTGDDFWFLRAGQSSSFGDYALKAFDPAETGSQPELNRYRPLYSIAWWVQYQAFGLHAFPYHAVVLALHLVCVVLAWNVSRRLLGAGAIANVTTLIFALHPAYADAVAWISGGNRVFAAVPAFASLLLFMRWSDGAQPRALALAASFACYIAAILMHSSTVTLAAVFAAFTFLVAGRPADALRPRSWWPFIPFAVVAAGSFVLQRWVRGHIGADGFSFDWHMYANYGQFLGMVAVPVETYRNDGFDAVASDIKLAASFVVLAACIALVTRRPHHALGVFAVIWLALALLPDSTFVAGIFGRGMYVGGPAVALLVVSCILFARDLLSPKHLHRAESLAPYAAALVIIPLALFTFGRTRGTSADAADYHGFASALRAEVDRVPADGILYISGAPMPASPSASHAESLARMYYGDIDVTVLPPGAVPPPLTPGDVWFAYAP